ncbi:hypothetical protein [Leucothrix pacifica]|uniref:Uncharacterized protein n=1 Tax=Leucothrix pacifica TaxID=1247513 RepID=A0A317CMZ5_9GAMM|nr:hypothetical protein [Leucothrix pacifica]PWQ97680.1 hypothetical protein DKW60_09900 [Leucothrix pacifica]
MSATAEQLVIPMPVQEQQAMTESMTFKDELSRDSYVIQQRAYGWEVFLNYQGVNQYGVELYLVTRRKLS